MLDRVSVIAAVLAGLTGCGGGCDNPTPMDDLCTDTQVGSADTLEIGEIVNGEFSPVVDDEIVDRVFGGQGFAMLVIALRYSGPDIPDCVAQSTEVRDDNGSIVASEDLGVHTYAGTDGTYTTSDMFLILGDVYSGERVRVTVQSAGQTAERTLFLDYSVDAGIPFDGGTTDSGPGIDANGSDAAIPDSGPDGG